MPTQSFGCLFFVCRSNINSIHIWYKLTLPHASNKKIAFAMICDLECPQAVSWTRCPAKMELLFTARAFFIWGLLQRIFFARQRRGIAGSGPGFPVGFQASSMSAVIFPLPVLLLQRRNELPRETVKFANVPWLCWSTTSAQALCGLAQCVLRGR